MGKKVEEKYVPSKKMKPFYWGKLSNRAVGNSIWPDVYNIEVDNIFLCVDSEHNYFFSFFSLQLFFFLISIEYIDP